VFSLNKSIELFVFLKVYFKWVHLSKMNVYSAWNFQIKHLIINFSNRSYMSNKFPFVFYRLYNITHGNILYMCDYICVINSIKYSDLIWFLMFFKTLSSSYEPNRILSLSLSLFCVQGNSKSQTIIFNVFIITLILPIFSRTRCRFNCSTSTSIMIARIIYNIVCL